MSRKEQWIVRLGPAEWARFASVQQTNQFQLLGSVKRGARIGALALTPDGRYLQVNGDYVSDLNPSQIRRAVKIATSKTASSTRPRAAQRHGAATPVVVIKRRRVLTSSADH